MTSEALRICEQLVRVVRPQPAGPLAAGLAPLAVALEETVRGRLTAQDQDQEVKEAAISAAASILSALGDVTPQQVIAIIL